MNSDNNEIAIKFLDHVAIRVKDMEIAAAWYEEVLGLKKYKLPAWGESPIFMLSGKTGVALFPAALKEPKVTTNSRNVKIDHFAFNVTLENFKKAKKRFTELDLDYSIQDHHYFHSIYTRDPDGHVVELTTIVVDETEFYQK